MRVVHLVHAVPLPAGMTGAERPAWWAAPVIGFLIAALLTVTLRDAAGDALRKPAPVLPPASNVAARIQAPRLAHVPDLPAPLVRPRRRTQAATSARTTTAPLAPAPTPAPVPVPVEERPAPGPSSAQTAPREPPPAPEPPDATPQPTPAPTFDDSGSGPVFDDSGPNP